MVQSAFVIGGVINHRDEYRENELVYTAGASIPSARTPAPNKCSSAIERAFLVDRWAWNNGCATFQKSGNSAQSPIC